MKIKVPFSFHRWGLVLVAAIFSFFLFAAWLVWQGKDLWQKTQILEGDVLAVRLTWQKKDLSGSQKALQRAKQDLASLQGDYRRLAFLSFCPFLNRYYHDGQHFLAAARAGLQAGDTFLTAIEPYQDFLGFGGKQTQSGQQTAADRMQFLVETADSLAPKIQQLAADVAKARQELLAIDSQRYPQNWRGQPLRSRLLKAQGLVNDVSNLLTQGGPLINQMAWLLGNQEPRFYLVIFQNDGEIRSTGGFWTAYGLFKVQKGKIKPVFSDDIYNLDRRFSQFLSPPPMLARYLKVKRWHLRDMNTDPDFAVSAARFLKFYRQLSGRRQIDGVIAVDTQVLVRLLKVLGRIGVPGWGNFSAQADSRCFGCPQVVYQLEVLADKPRSSLVKNRKGFLGPVLHSLLSNIIGAPRQQVPALARALWQSLQEKHILLYFPNPTLEMAISHLGFGGRLDESDGDYLQVNDNNLGGAKANLFIRQTIESDYYFSHGQLYKKVTVSYYNPAPASACNLEKGDLCLNSNYRDWFRLYLAPGTKLIHFKGSEIKVKVSEELGKTVVSGFFGNQNPLYPRSKLVISGEFLLPLKQRHFKLLLQKQPGSRVIHQIVKVNGHKIFDKEVKKDYWLEIQF